MRYWAVWLLLLAAVPAVPPSSAWAQLPDECSVQGQAGLPDAERRELQDQMRQAYALGWRCESNVSSAEFLRRYWTDQLRRLSVELPPDGADWQDLRAQVQQVLASRGLQTVQRGALPSAAAAGQALPPATGSLPVAAGLLPANAGEAAYLTAYADVLRTYRRVLPYTFPCVFRITSRTPIRQLPSGSALLPDECEQVQVRLAALRPEARFDNRLCPQDALDASFGVWRDGYRDLSNWTPPPGFEFLHHEVISSLALLDLAADTMQLPQTESERRAREIAEEERREELRACLPIRPIPNFIRLQGLSLASRGQERLESLWPLFDTAPFPY
jgi:hypothetical protein